MDVGFIGLGSMGGAMARNLAKAGHGVRAWNRSPVDPADLPGVAIVATPREALQADVLLTMLSEDGAIREVLLDSDLLDHARAGLVHVVTATISIAFSATLAEDHARRRIGYVAAPVFGRPDVAEAAQLNIVVAGADEAVATVMPVLEVLSKKVWPLGAEPTKANAAKIAGNMMITMAIRGAGGGVRAGRRQRRAGRELPRPDARHAVRRPCLRNLWPQDRRERFRARVPDETGSQGS